MRENTYRILDILAREIGNPMSINSIKNNISQIYGIADYKNIYTSIQEMMESDLITIEKIGKSSIAVLNFENPLLIDLLAEMEIRRKTMFLEKRQDLQLLLIDLNTNLKDFYFIKSMSIINPEKNAKLNRTELLIIMKNSKKKGDIQGEATAIQNIMNVLQNKHNIRIDHILINGNAFLELLVSDEINSAREMLSNKIVLSNPQTFWIEIMTTLQEGMNIKSEEEIHPAKISENDIVYNLARFGYKESGTKITKGRPISIEHIITAILLKDKSIRRIEAIPVLLGKNEKHVNYNLLVFLATKFHVPKRLYEILKILNAIKPAQELTRALNVLKNSTMYNIKDNQKKINLNLKDIEKKMRLYNVIE